MPTPARAANLQRLTYLIGRQAVEQRISRMLTRYDALQEQLDGTLSKWLAALERGDMRQAEMHTRQLKRMLNEQWADLPGQERADIADIAELMGQAGALAADLPIFVLDRPDLTLPQVINATTLQPRVSAGIYFAIGQEVRDAVERHVYQDGLNLSQRLHVRLAERQEEFYDIVAQGLSTGRASVRIGAELSELDVTSPSFPRYLDELVQATRSGNMLARDKALVNALKQAAKRKQGPLGVKDAVDRLIEAAQKGNARAMDKAIEAFIQYKARYHAIVIARTEGAEAFREGLVTRAEQMPDLVRGIKWNLSTSHPRKDVCDEYATQDKYGLGAGVYPPKELPSVPHPGCMCYWTMELSEAESETQDEEQAA